MTTCKQLGYGFIPWSWTGNNKENAWLDIVDSRDWKNPTWWGREVIDGECGIRKLPLPPRSLKNRWIGLRDFFQRNCFFLINNS